MFYVETLISLLKGKTESECKDEVPSGPKNDVYIYFLKQRKYGQKIER